MKQTKYKLKSYEMRTNDEWAEMEYNIGGEWYHIDDLWDTFEAMDLNKELTWENIQKVFRDEL